MVELEEQQLLDLLEKGDLASIQAVAPSIEEAEREDEKVPEPNIRQIIQKAGLPQKLKLALFGNSTCRQLLIRESNKLICLGVLKNPRLQISEVEDYAKNPNIPEIVLRSIGHNSTFTKHASLRRNLIFNPKCPLDVSLTLAKYLPVADIKLLSRSKSISAALSGFAKKRLDALSTK